MIQIEMVKIKYLYIYITVLSFADFLLQSWEHENILPALRDRLFRPT